MCCVKYIFECVEFEVVDICTSTAFSGIFLQKVQHRSSIALSSADNRYVASPKEKRTGISCHLDTSMCGQFGLLHNTAVRGWNWHQLSMNASCFWSCYSCGLPAWARIPGAYVWLLADDWGIRPVPVRTLYLITTTISILFFRPYLLAILANLYCITTIDKTYLRKHIKNWRGLSGA